MDVRDLPLAPPFGEQGQRLSDCCTLVKPDLRDDRLAPRASYRCPRVRVSAGSRTCDIVAYNEWAVLLATRPAERGVLDLTHRYAFADFVAKEVPKNADLVERRFDPHRVTLARRFDLFLGDHVRDHAPACLESPRHILSV